MNIIENNLKFRNDMNVRKVTKGVILHHAGTSTCTIEDIHRWHLNNDWAGVGYQFFVRKDGSIYRGRPENAVGVHCPGANSESIGICAEGNYEVETMPEAQKNAIIELLAYIKSKYPIEYVRKHSYYVATDCPGRNYPFDEIVNGQAINPTPTPVNNNTIIHQIQSTYNARYGNILGQIVVDGSAGRDTRKHLIMALQCEMNKQYGCHLDRDGSFGLLSRAQFLDLKRGVSGNITWICQAFLYIKGYDPNGLDSSYGSGMEDCVKQYQRNNGLKVDGILGMNTAYKLFN